MANQMKHSGSVPECMFVVSIAEEKIFWVYIKEGHALNRLLKERGAGRSVIMTKFCKDIASTVNTDNGA